jgi:hypothetical protein
MRLNLSGLTALRPLDRFARLFLPDQLLERILLVLGRQTLLVLADHKQHP